MGGGEQRRHRPALGDREYRRALAAGSVHHGGDIVHRLLQRRRPPESVGKPLAALVEDQQPRERRQPAQEAGERRLFPDQLDVGDEARHEDEVQRPLPVDLKGDADAVGGLRISRLGFHPDLPPTVSPSPRLGQAPLWKSQPRIKFSVRSFDIRG
jgi:hypothetical protein